MPAPPPRRTDEHPPHAADWSAGDDVGDLPRDVEQFPVRDDLGPVVDDGRWDLLLAALNSVNSMVTLTDLRADDQPLVYVNDYFCTFTGYGRDEILGKNCRFLQTCAGGRDEDQPGVREVRDAIRERRRCKALLRNYKKDGSPFWNELFLSPVCPGGGGGGGGGEPTHYVGVQNDVTERVECDRERYVLSESLRTLEESVVITEGELDEPGPKMRFVNDAFTRMSGYGWDELIGNTPRMLQGPDTDHGETSRLKRDLKAGRTFRGEAVNYRKGGGRYLVQWTASPVWAYGPSGGLYGGPGMAGRGTPPGGLRHDPPAGLPDRPDRSGPPSHFVASQRDVTERRSLEREMLEGRGEEQARIARDLHDGPTQDVAAVRLMAAALAREMGVNPDDPAALDAAAKTDDGADRFDSAAALAAHLYRQADAAADGVRQVARGLMPVRPAPGGLIDALNRLASTLAAAASRGVGPAVSFDGGRDDEPTDADVRNELYQIAREAVGNAVRHADAKTIRVALSRDDADRVVLTVEDDGRGIDPDLAAAAGGTDRPRAAAPGGGVGLRSMRYRTELLSATFRVERRDDGGTRVFVRLPAGGPPRGKREVIRGEPDPDPTPPHRRR